MLLYCFILNAGEPRKFDPKFRGPIHNRHCTDIICCVIFIVVILGYIALGVVAWVHGDPRKVIYPTDSYGQFLLNPFTYLYFGMKIFEDYAISWYWILMAIGYIMSTLFYPIVTFLLIAICISYWAVTAVFLATSGEPVYKVMANQTLCKYANLTCDPETFNTTNVTKLCPGAQCTFAFYGGESLYHKYIFIFQLANAFVFLWLVNFAIALGQCTLAGAFASYYWAYRKPADIPLWPLFSSFGRAIRYHTGSLAFGALILAVVQLIRVILEYLDHKLKGTQNSVTRFLLCCLQCCFWCLEKFLKFINRNAYIMIAIYGKNFCTSAKEAFFLLMRNVVRVAVLDKVTDFLLFLGKILVAGGVGVLAFFFFTQRIPVFAQEVPMLNYYWVPLLTVIIGSYLVAHGFFSVYAMCVDTLFLCFCEDLERNDGSTAKPYFMSASLHRILGKKKLSPKKASG
uniref:Choline transporter-like protein n=1 Tax=Serinus canaria TaxID=9135 RepID=A0A8C9N2G0_SERCA